MRRGRTSRRRRRGREGLESTSDAAVLDDELALEEIEEVIGLLALDNTAMRRLITRLCDYVLDEDTSGT